MKFIPFQITINLLKWSEEIFEDWGVKESPEEGRGRTNRSIIISAKNGKSQVQEENRRVNNRG